MTYLVYFFALVSNYWMSRKKQNSIFILISTAIIMLLLWVGNTEGPDIANYEMTYSRVSFVLKEKGSYQFIYYSVMWLLNSLGMTFYEYRFIITLVGLIILFICIRKFNTNIHLVIFMYLLTEFFLDGIQIRNFLAMSFLIIGIVILVERKKFWRLWYTFIIIVASLIHISFFVYLIFLFIPSSNYNKGKLIKVHGIVGLLLTLFILSFGRQLLDVLISLLIYVDARKVESYTQVSSNFGAIIPITLQLLGIFVSRHVYRNLSRLKQNKPNDKKIEKDCNVTKTFFWINLLSCYLIPFSIIEITFYRLIRNIVLINFITLGIGKKYFKESNNILLIIIIYIIAWITTEFFILNDLEKIVLPFFTSNRYL